MEEVGSSWIRRLFSVKIMLFYCLNFLKYVFGVFKENKIFRKEYKVNYLLIDTN